MSIDSKIVVTLSRPVQIGQDDWKQYYTSRLFSVQRPIIDLLQWAESEGFNNPTIGDLILSDYTGEST